jgi:uncharacterized protein
MSLTQQDILSCIANDRLHLILMSTEACNFRCTYCYEDFRHKRMEPWVVRGVKKFLSRRAPELRLLEISWFGGEPTLTPDIIEDIMRHVQGLLSSNPQIQLKTDMTTNAYLLDRRCFERMLALGIGHFQISFDGPQEWHDRKRVLAGGHGTFRRIWTNVLAMQRLPGDFTVTVRLHIDRENHAALRDFIDAYSRVFGTDSRFRLFLRTLSCLGGPNDSRLPVFDDVQGRDAVRQLAKYAASLKLRHVTIEQHSSVCYASRANSFLVRSDGRLGKCTVALEHPNNHVGAIREDGNLEEIASKMYMWMRGLWDQNEELLECPMPGCADAATRSVPETTLHLPVTGNLKAECEKGPV